MNKGDLKIERLQQYLDRQKELWKAILKSITSNWKKLSLFLWLACR